MELILRQLDSLPTLPSVATRLLSLTASRQTSAEQIVEAIQADQTLTAKLLSLAGRASTGLRKEARTVEKAVLMLGFDAVRSAVLSIKVLETFGTRGPAASRFDRAEFWKHCVGVACAAELIAASLHLSVDPEEAFTCGLLHDLGKLAMDYCLPKSYARAIEAADSQFGNIAEYERHVIGIDHSLLGRRLAQMWRLPALIEQVIWLHHQPVEALPEMLSGRRMIAVVHLADTLVREQRFGYSGNHTFPRSSAELAADIGLAATQLQRITESLPSQIEQRCALLGLGQTTSEALLRSALSGANAELGRLNDAYRQRLARLGEQSRALRLNSEFGAALSARMSLSSLCEHVGRSWAQCVAVAPSPSSPVLAYVTPSAEAPADEKVVLAALTGDEPARLILLPRSRSADGQTAPPQDATTQAVLELLGIDADLLSEYLGPEPLRHRALVCAGLWVGGVMWPSAGVDATEDPARQSLATTMAFALAAVTARDDANVLAEQLSQASQSLYAAQKELTEARTLAAVGEMAAGAAHEINNPLAVVVGRAELMADSTSGKDAQTWRTIADQAQRMSDIVTELMEFARPPKPKPQAVEVAELVRAAREKLPEAIAGMKVDLSVGDGVPPVQVDPAQMAAVLAELMTNAAAAYAENPHARIEAALQEVSGQVLVRVIDHGSGMDAATLRDAFTPFFSAKKAGRARGLGLSKAKRFVQLAGGKIWIKSEPDKGTTVYVSLPRGAFAAAGPTGKAQA